MKKKLFIVLCFCIITLLSGCTSNNTVSQDEYDRVVKENEALAAQVTELQNKQGAMLDETAFAEAYKKNATQMYNEFIDLLNEIENGNANTKDWLPAIKLYFDTISSYVNVNLQIKNIILINGILTLESMPNEQKLETVNTLLVLTRSINTSMNDITKSQWEMDTNFEAGKIKEVEYTKETKENIEKIYKMINEEISN